LTRGEQWRDEYWYQRSVYPSEEIKSAREGIVKTLTTSRFSEKGNPDL
jgi:hypothetical protein